ncbi:MAG: N-succinylarginine dihydrolase, partial [Planctomycetes bacterium]|nr:N-succinylarginine dihydrolase [Planctomycetota bacterium]
MPTGSPGRVRELNLDGLVGPTHHYGGLGLGNVASQRHRHEISNPRAAALEGIAKMRLMVDLGLPQAILPPQERPLMSALRRLGFAGSDTDVLTVAGRRAPDLLSAVSSTSSMWAANAASVSPAADTADGRVHLTPTNLVSQFHRSLETPATADVLARIFPAGRQFAHHPALPATDHFGDEGAANQMRLAPCHGSAGVEVFVFGRDGDAGGGAARQSRAAAEAVSRLHSLSSDRTVFLRQSDAALAAGVFHNDVIAVANERLLLVHEQAYREGEAALDRIRTAYAAASHELPTVIEVPAAVISLADAVTTYLFNSQLVSLPAGGMALICPTECREHPAVSRWLDEVLAGDNPVVAVHPVAVRQSMANGGGPACLRLRVAVDDAAFATMHPGVVATPPLLEAL